MAKSPPINNTTEITENEENEIEEGFDELSEIPLDKLSPAEFEKLKTEFEDVTLPHFRLLYNYAYRITGNMLEAQDLVQDTYLRAFRFFTKFEQGTNSKAWLFRILRNLFINNYRKSQKEPGKVDYEEVENFISDIMSERMESNDLEEKIFKNILDDEVTLALNTLQDDFKTVVILRDLEDLSYDEIADFLKVPVGTVRSRLHRGRNLLREKLIEYARNKGYETDTIAAD
ncbi:sigma-70 family RNA polymerase sigma factor [soil metagenome]